MKQILHRQNDPAALYRSITSDSEGFFSRWDGVEIDVLPSVTSRERNNLQLFVAHDQMARIGRSGKTSAPTLGAWLAQLRGTLKTFERKEPFYVFIDVKAANICGQLSEVVYSAATMDRAHGVRIEYVLFDLPGQDLAEYAATSLRLADRLSEFEHQEIGDITLLDILLSTTDVSRFAEHLHNNRHVPVAVIDPSLHERSSYWPMYEQFFLKNGNPSFLITKQYRHVTVNQEQAS